MPEYPRAKPDKDVLYQAIIDGITNNPTEYPSGPGQMFEIATFHTLVTAKSNAVRNRQLWEAEFRIAVKAEHNGYASVDAEAKRLITLAERKHAQNPGNLQLIGWGPRTASIWDEALLAPEEWFNKGSDLQTIGKVTLDRIAEGWRPEVRYVGAADARLLSGDVAAWTTSLTCWMLIGMAVECWLKGLIVGAEKPESFPKNLEHHRLGELAKRAGLSVSSEEQALLESLERLILGFGRYPAPKHRHQDFVNEEVLKWGLYEPLTEKILARKDELLSPDIPEPGP